MAADKRQRDWNVLGAAMRRHPSYESPAPAAPDTWPPAVREAPAPTPPAPTPLRSAFPRTGPQWAVGIATVLTALGTTLGGIGYVVTEYRKSAAASALEVSARLERIENVLHAIKNDQEARDIASLAVLCELNKGPPARGVRCPPNACEPHAVGPDGKVLPGQPLCKATIDWPSVRLGP